MKTFKNIIITLIVFVVVGGIGYLFERSENTKHYQVQDLEGYEILMPWDYYSSIDKPFETGDQIWINLKTGKLAPNDPEAIQFEIVKQY